MAESEGRVTNFFDDPLMRGLACAAIAPSLRSVLVFDADRATLQFAAEAIAKMLEAVTSQKVEKVTLGAIASEDDLWGNLGLHANSDGFPFEWQSGLLVNQNRDLRLVVIPDLTRLSLAATRACVMLLSADVGHLERYGQQQSWQPSLCWLVGCDSKQVGMVSTHLLDRLALRLRSGVAPTLETDVAKVTRLLDWLSGDQNSEDLEHSVELPDDLIAQIQAAVGVRARLTGEASDRILEYVTVSDRYQQSLEIDESIGNVQGKAATLHSMGIIYAQQGQIDQAIALYQNSLEIYERIGNVMGKSTTLHQMASIYVQQGQIEQAIALYQQSLEIDEQIGNVQGKAATLHSMGIIYAQQGQVDQALALYQQSLEINEHIGNVLGKASTLNMMGQLLATIGNYQTAISYLQESLSILQRLQSPNAEGVQEVLEQILKQTEQIQ